MKYATMYIAAGVEVNIARLALDEDVRSLIPNDGGYISNIFNNAHLHYDNVDDMIESIHGAIHENRERHREHERQANARRKGEIICAKCNAQGKPRSIKVSGSMGPYDTEVCRSCGAELE